MVIKILPRSRNQKWGPGPRVCLPKIDITSYRGVVPSTSQSTSSGCVKKETTLCFFNSEVDLNDNGNNVYVDERSVACQCGYCSPLYEFKNRAREEFIAQQRANSPLEPSYIDEFPYVPDVQRLLPPQPVFATNAGTQTENKIYRFTCKDCGSEFNDEHFFDHHRKAHAKMLECAFCDAQFFNEKSLETHIFLHLETSVFACIYCQAVYRKKRFLNEHLRVHQRYMYNCISCSAKFETKKGLELHRKTHLSSGSLVHVFRKLKANQAPSSDDVVVETVAPVAIRKDPPKVKNGFFDCEKCNLKFKREGELRKHSIIHSRNARNYLHFCTKCNARFKTNGHLLIHLKAAHKALL